MIHEPERSDFNIGEHHGPAAPLMPCDPHDAYDFEQIAPRLYSLSIAVPGFERGDIGVSADAGCLRISGVRPRTDRRGRLLHRGIDDEIDRTFLMLRPLEVAAWNVRAGLLRVDLEEGPDIGALAARPPALHQVEAVAMAA